MYRFLLGLFLALSSSTLSAYNENYYHKHGDESTYRRYEEACQPPPEPCCEPLCSRGEYFIMANWYLTMSVGAENVITGHRFLLKFDDLNWEPAILHQCNLWGRLLRLVRISVLDTPAAELALVLQHEIFGHGARLREQQINPGYEIKPPYPYGRGGGATYYDGLKYLTLTAQERLAVTVGGVESTEVLARSLAHRILCHGQIDFRQAILYTHNYHDLTHYVYTIAAGDKYDDGHDIMSYIMSYNLYCPDDPISSGFLQSRVWINYLDPLTWYSIGSVWNYIWNGSNCCRVPMLCLWGVQVLPSIRYHLAPFGPEYGLHSYFIRDGLLAEGYMRWGEACDNTTLAAGINCPRFWCWRRWVLGGKFDIWYQPDNHDFSDLRENFHPGASLLVRATHELGCSYGFIVETGVKSRGWVPGEPLSSHIFARLGLMLLDF